MGSVAGYVRVSTEDQSVERQLSSIRDYCSRALDAEPADFEIYRDKSTGTNTNRSGYRELMDDVEEKEFDAVAVHSISRISRSIRDLERTVDRIVRENDCELHIISESLVLSGEGDDAMQNAMYRLLGVFAEFEAELAQTRIKEGIAARQQEDGYHHGPAPLGFEKDDGYLVEGERYDQVTTTLEMVAKNQMSKRKAAKELDTSRATINRALDRGELYGL